MKTIKVPKELWVKLKELATSKEVPIYEIIDSAIKCKEVK